MQLPSATLLAQSILSGVFIGGLYALLGLGLTLSWGLLRQINLAYFALTFLGAYWCYELASVRGLDPLATLVVIAPAFFVLGALLQWILARFRVSPFNSLLITFGLTVIVESVIQAIWTADFRRLESAYGTARFKLAGLYFPLPELLTLVVAVVLSIALWAALRYTDLGRAMRGAAEDAQIARAFGVNQRLNALLLSGTCAALSGIAGVCMALSFTLAPAQIYAWIGIVFAAVMLGGVGRALGPLVGGIVIGVSEAVTMALTAPSWAPLVSFSLLLLLLLLRPGRD
jgi:branched-chain amino acid transport system permease protein